MEKLALVACLLFSAALGAAEPPALVVEADAVRLQAGPFTDERLDAARARGDADLRLEGLDERLVAFRQWYAARGQEPARLQVQVAREARVDLVRRALHTLDIAGVSRTEAFVDGKALFPTAGPIPACRARYRACAAPRVDVTARGVTAVLQYGTAERRRACDARGRPGPVAAPAWAGRRIPDDGGEALPLEGLVQALAAQRDARSCPRATVVVSPTATAGAVVDVVAALKKAGYTELVVETAPVAPPVVPSK